MSDKQYMVFKDKKGKVISVASKEDGGDAMSTLTFSISVAGADEAQNINESEFNEHVKKVKTGEADKQ
jgi:hypothetical protein